MPKQIKYMDSKAERKRERQRIGRLSVQRVTQGTKERYQHSLKEVAEFAGVSTDRLLSTPGLDGILSDYIERLWEDGDTKSVASYALAALQFHQPTLKGQLRQSWRLLSLWNKLEQPRRATPLDPKLLLGFAGVFLRWQWDDLAHLVVVGFCGLLRTGEMFQLRRQDVVLPRYGHQSAILFLHDTKTAQRNLLTQEKVLITEEMGIYSLRCLCKGKAPGDLLVETTAPRFRTLWKEVVQALKLEGLNYLPYSLRRGAATSAYREGMGFDQLLAKGRWQHIATARLYLDQSLQELAALTIPMAAEPLIRAARTFFLAAKSGTRGGGG